MSKQILRDEEKLKELKKKYFEKKRLRAVANDKLVEACKMLNTDETTSTSIDTVDSVDFDNNNSTINLQNVSTINAFTLQQQQQQHHKSINGLISRKIHNKKLGNNKINCDLKTKNIINQSTKKYDKQMIIVTANNNNNTINYHQQNSYISNTSNSLNNNIHNFNNIHKRQKLLNGSGFANIEHFNQLGDDRTNEIFYLNHNSHYHHHHNHNNNVIIHANHSASSSGTHSDESVISKSDEHEIIDNLFDNLINDNLLDPLNSNEYDGEDDDHAMQSVNYIQETFQNSFDKIQEKLDADLEVSNEQLKWEDTLKSDDSSDEIMSDKLLGIDENVMLI